MLHPGRYTWSRQLCPVQVNGSGPAGAPGSGRCFGSQVSASGPGRCTWPRRNGVNQLPLRAASSHLIALLPAPRHPLWLSHDAPRGTPGHHSVSVEVRMSGQTGVCPHHTDSGALAWSQDRAAFSAVLTGHGAGRGCRERVRHPGRRQCTHLLRWVPVGLICSRPAALSTLPVGSPRPALWGQTSRDMCLEH